MLQEFQELESTGLPALAPDLAVEPIAADAKSIDSATSDLLARIKREILVRSPGGEEDTPALSVPRPAVAALVWKQVVAYARTPLAVAAVACLAVALSLYSYHLRAKRVADISGEKLKQTEAKEVLQAEIKKFSADRESLKKTLESRSRTIDDLTQKIDLQLREIAVLRKEKRSLAAAAHGEEQKNKPPIRNEIN